METCPLIATRLAGSCSMSNSNFVSDLLFESLGVHINRKTNPFSDPKLLHPLRNVKRSHQSLVPHRNISGHVNVRQSRCRRLSPSRYCSKRILIQMYLSGNYFRNFFICDTLFTPPTTSIGSTKCSIHHQRRSGLFSLRFGPRKTLVVLHL